jgi:hypothetical protein
LTVSVAKLETDWIPLMAATTYNSSIDFFRRIGATSVYISQNQRNFWQILRVRTPSNSCPGAVMLAWEEQVDECESVRAWVWQRKWLLGRICISFCVVSVDL